MLKELVTETAATSLHDQFLGEFTWFKQFNILTFKEILSENICTAKQEHYLLIFYNYIQVKNVKSLSEL